jgi:hypothetical protein
MQVGKKRTSKGLCYFLGLQCAHQVTRRGNNLPENRFLQELINLQCLSHAEVPVDHKKNMIPGKRGPLKDFLVFLEKRTYKGYFGIFGLQCAHQVRRLYRGNYFLEDFDIFGLQCANQVTRRLLYIEEMIF